MAKLNIEIESAYRDMVAYSILYMAKEHRAVCNSSNCGINLFPFRSIIEQLLERPITDEERNILS